MTSRARSAHAVRRCSRCRGLELQCSARAHGFATSTATDRGIRRANNTRGTLAIRSSRALGIQALAHAAYAPSCARRRRGIRKRSRGTRSARACGRGGKCPRRAISTDSAAAARCSASFALSARARAECRVRPRSTRRRSRAAVTRVTSRTRCARAVRRLRWRGRLVLSGSVALQHAVAYTVARARRRSESVLARRTCSHVRRAAAIRRHRRCSRLPLARCARRHRRARSAIVGAGPCRARHTRLACAVCRGGARGLLALARRARAPRGARLSAAAAGSRERATRTRRA